MPTFAHEHPYWAHQYIIAGLDEAGMGALAGPVVAAAVIFDATSIEQLLTTAPAIRDSKTLSAPQRERAATWIQTHALTTAVGEASVAEITTLNIRRAAHLAMRRAITQLQPAPHLLLLDGNPAEIHPTIPSINIIDGDALSVSIAAASILAKVHRDQIMTNLAEEFPAYGFAQHKGYGSASHLNALKTHGPCLHHRPTYAPIQNAIQRAREDTSGTSIATSR